MLSVYSIALFLSQFAFGAVQISPVAADPVLMQKQILAKINEQRTENNEKSLNENSLLDQAAKNKLNDMFNKNYWDHTSPTGEKAWVFIDQTGYSYTSAGENLAKGFNSAENTVNAWMDSPSHKKNILDSQFTETGVAVGTGKINGKETTLAVQLFGAPSAVFAQGQALVAGEKTESPRFSLENPTLTPKVPYFVIYLVIFAMIIFDGVVIRLNKTHKKDLLAFRTSLGINILVLLVLCVNITQVW